MGRQTGAQRRSEYNRKRKLRNQPALTNDMSLTEKDKQDAANEAVSYTHLTLPTKA